MPLSRRVQVVFCQTRCRTHGVPGAVQGMLKVVTLRDSGERVEERTSFFMLGLDLPPPPLFADALEKNIIPQVPLNTILAKFNGRTEHEVLRQGRRTYSIEQLPPFLILHMKRFTKARPVAGRLTALLGAV